MRSKRYTVTASAESSVLVEVRLSRTRKQMLQEIKRLDGAIEDKRTAGFVRSWCVRSTNIGATRPRHGRRVVARVYLCKSHLSTEVFTHEAGHAAMAYSRLKRADLRQMPGEEVMCYSLGHICAELGNLFHRIGAWK